MPWLWPKRSARRVACGAWCDVARRMRTAWAFPTLAVMLWRPLRAHGSEVKGPCRSICAPRALPNKRTRAHACTTRRTQGPGLLAFIGQEVGGGAPCKGTSFEAKGCNEAPGDTASAGLLLPLRGLANWTVPIRTGATGRHASPIAWASSGAAARCGRSRRTAAEPAWRRTGIQVDHLPMAPDRTWRRRTAA